MNASFIPVGRGIFINFGAALISQMRCSRSNETANSNMVTVMEWGFYVCVLIAASPNRVIPKLESDARVVSYE